MEVRKRSRSSPPQSAEAPVALVQEPTITVRKRVRVMEPPAPEPEPPKPVQRHQSRAASFVGDWQDRIGTDMDPIIHSVYKPANLVKCTVHMPGSFPGDNTMGFIIRLDQSTLAVYYVDLDGHMRFLRRVKGIFNDAFKALSDRAREIALTRARMKRAPKHYT